MGTFTLGLKKFSARSAHEEAQPLTIPYSKNPDTTYVRAGHPLFLTSGATGGDLVSRATLSGTQILRSTILGFAAHEEQYITENVDYAGFGLPIAPPRRRSDNNITGLQQMQVYVADSDTIFTAALRSGILATQGLVGQTAGFYLEEGSDAAATSVFAIDTGLPQGEILTIIGIHPSDVGKNAGRVDFKVTSTAREYS